MFRKNKLKQVVSKRQLSRRIRNQVQTELKQFNNLEDNSMNENASFISNSFFEINEYISVSGIEDDAQNITMGSEFSGLSAVVSNNDLQLSNNDDVNNLNLKDEIKKWAISEKISHTAVTSLLHTLHDYHSELPLDCRTLLKTSRQIQTKHVGNGEYIHFNLKVTLKQTLEKNTAVLLTNEIFLIFNIDGLPLFHSSSTQFWPILCILKNGNFNFDPFVVGLFCGTGKPTNVNLFLEDFIKDVSELLTHGIEHNGIIYTVKIRSFICDVPAKAYIKCVKSHGGYSSCDKCTEYGKHINGRVVLHKLNAQLRTDDSFGEQADENHHVGISPLTKLNVGLVSLFAIDYIHAVCLGVMKKLLNSWIGGCLNVRLPSRIVSAISNHMLSLRNCIPVEINRRPRSLSDLPQWKATEFRTFLLYIGPIVLKNIDIAVFEHFLLLHSSISILGNPKFIEHFGTNFTKNLLHTFVAHCKELYGLEYFVYNIHILIHLSDDVKNFGPLDSFSAFPFENYLGQIKKLIKSPNKPLQQIYSRLVEINSAAVKGHSTLLTSAQFLNEHLQGPILNMTTSSCIQYKKVILPHYTLTVNSYSIADSYCIISEGVVIEIHNILKSRKTNKCLLVGKEFLFKEAFYNYPFDSNLLHIYVLKSLSELKMWTFEVNNLPSKCIVFPFSEGMWVSFPLIHTI